jgi:hypothetical protein
MCSLVVASRPGQLRSGRVAVGYPAGPEHGQPTCSAWTAAPAICLLSACCLPASQPRASTLRYAPSAGAQPAGQVTRRRCRGCIDPVAFDAGPLASPAQRSLEINELQATAADIGSDRCSRPRCVPILVMCWSCDRIANAVTGTSTRHRWTCSSARTSAPGAATAQRTSCTASARIAEASSSGAPSAQPACSQSTRRRPGGSWGQAASRHPPADLSACK